MLLSDLLILYRRHNLNISDRSLVEYRAVTNELDRWLGRPAKLADLSESTILAWLRFSLERRSARTVNNRRQVLLTLLRFARRRKLTKLALPEVPRVQVPELIPRAWTVQEVARILAGCSAARCLAGWDQRHWRALVLVLYDTSHRIGALLQAERSQVTPQGWLMMLASQTKQRADTLHRLHPDTLDAIRAMPEHRLLFPWPLHRRAIWSEYDRILMAAGLPTGPRNKFHRIRRTSASYLARECGERAAEQHLGHRTPGLARRCYLDPAIIGAPQAVDVLPRPLPLPLSHGG